MINSLPKILIVSRTVWDDTLGTSSTLSNIFSDYNPNKLAHIFIESKKPKTELCKSFYQISEFSLLLKLIKPKLKTGKRLTSDSEYYDSSLIIEKNENKIFAFVRKHRSVLFSFLRELLWLLNSWKTDDLKQYIDEFNPDFIWIDGSPLICMNRLSKFVIKHSAKPYSIFIMDDIVTYKNDRNILQKFYKLFLRSYSINLIKYSNIQFVISPMMQREFDKLLNINSTFISKGYDFTKKKYDNKINKPLKLVYLGQVIYGRVYSLIEIVENLKEINKDGTLINLEIYTMNYIDEKLRRKLEVKNTSTIKEPVSYNEVQGIIEGSDILLMIESFKNKFKNIARLSYSTKISDYLYSGKCIFVYGPKDIAPIEFFIENNAGIVATERNELKLKLNDLLNENLVNFYSKNAQRCARNFHDKEKNNKLIFGNIFSILNIS